MGLLLQVYRLNCTYCHHFYDTALQKQPDKLFSKEEGNHRKEREDRGQSVR